MFKVEIKFDDDKCVDINLVFHFYGSVFCLTPEDPRIILGVDIDSNKGEIGSEISNGEFRLSWEGDFITICCAKFGSGDGGQSSLRLDCSRLNGLVAGCNTMRSLKLALKRWQKAMI